jgi:hypothetical protein
VRFSNDGDDHISPRLLTLEKTFSKLMPGELLCPIKDCISSLAAEF